MSNTTSAIQNRNRPASAFMIATALIAWFGLIAQFYVTLTTYDASRTLAGVIIEFFTYFTVICNLLIAVSITIILTAPSSGPGRFFSGHSTLTAITLYITIVGIVFNTVLRSLLTLTGLAWWLNEIMHVIVPLLFVLFWLLFVPKARLPWQNAFKWLWVPFIYMIVVMIRGAICGLYPYPFMNAAKYGYGQIAINYMILFVVILGFGLLLIFIDRLLAKK